MFQATSIIIVLAVIMACIIGIAFYVHHQKEKQSDIESNNVSEDKSNATNQESQPVLKNQLQEDVILAE